jgi:hypothetical protein
VKRGAAGRVRTWRAEAVVASVAFASRALALLWAAGRFPAATDGFYYHTLASRIAQGLGSTWLWPDGKVTYAAHYPVGYPALLALVYRWTGPTVVAAGWLQALLGTAGAVATYRLAAEAARPGLALAAGLAVALHPALVMYTPAVMTEGVTAALLAIAAYFASRRTSYGSVGLGVILGVATLVRPQSLLLAPCFGILATPPGATWPKRLRRAAIVTAVTVAVCLPWTIRNCVRMNQCALVSFNGGWNLLIGAHERATGTFAPLDVPEACRTVWDEAEKDACFAREARALVAREPWRWLRLVPAKLAATFDYSGAPGFYLHESNRDAFDDAAKRLLGVVETAYERFAYLGALVAAAFTAGPWKRTRWGVAGVSGVLLFQTHAYLSVLGLGLALALLGRELLGRPTLWGATLGALGTTLLAHAVFFGAGRYAMVVFPLVTALAFCLGRRAEEDDPRHFLTATGAGRDTEKKTEETAQCP